MMRLASMRLRAIALLVLGVSACSREPKDYDDCILKYVKPGMDRAAVGVVMRSCEERFPSGVSSRKGQSVERELTPREIAALDGRAGLSSRTYYSGNLYNGNSGMTVTAVRIRIVTKIGGKEDSRVYQDKVGILPHTTGRFGFEIIAGDQGAKYEWSIEGATGIPSR